MVKSLDCNCYWNWACAWLAPPHVGPNSSRALHQGLCQSPWSSLLVMPGEAMLLNIIIISLMAIEHLQNHLIFWFLISIFGLNFANKKKAIYVIERSFQLFLAESKVLLWCSWAAFLIHARIEICTIIKFFSVCNKLLTNVALRVSDRSLTAAIFMFTYLLLFSSSWTHLWENWSFPENKFWCLPVQY